jgi:hypothetical protein
MTSSFIFELTLSWKSPLLVSCGESPLLLLSPLTSRHIQESVRKLHKRLPFGATRKKSTGHLSTKIVNKPSWARVLLREANCSSASQEINHSLWKSKFHQHIHSSTPRILILSQVSLDHVPIPLLEDIFQYYPQSTHRSCNQYTSLRSPTQTMARTFPFPDMGYMTRTLRSS